MYVEVRIDDSVIVLADAVDARSVSLWPTVDMPPGRVGRV